MTDPTYADRYARSLMNVFGTPRRTLVSGEGCYVTDDEGGTYLDLLAGIGVNSLGHAHPRVVETVSRQIGRLGHVSNFFTTPAQVELGERLAGIVGAEARTFLCSSGTEAAEAAIKVTRRTGRTKVVAADGAFHGRTMGALSLTAKPAYREPFEPLPVDVVRVPYGDAAALDEAVDSETAAVVLEPVQGEAGIVVPPDGYLAAARQAATRHGALLWFDEVQSGMGRTGHWLAYQREQVVPDLVTLAKGLAAGVPVGALVAVGAAGELLRPGQHGTTFGGNPLAAATALTVLDVIESDGLRQAAATRGEQLRSVLEGLAGITEVRGEGLMIGAVLERPVSNVVALAGLDAGVIVNDCTPDVVRLLPPLVLSDTHVTEGAERIGRALDRAMKGEQ